jgi:hypothetical protein
VHLDQVELTDGIDDSGLREDRGGGTTGDVEAIEPEVLIEPGVGDPGDRGDRGDPDRGFAPWAGPDDVLGSDDQGGGTVGDRAAVLDRERRGDDRRGQGPLQARRPSQVRLRMLAAVAEVLDRHRRQIGPGPAIAVEAARGQQREQVDVDQVGHRRRLRLRRQAAGAVVGQLLHPTDEGDVDHAAGHRETSLAEGVGPGRAEILHPGHRDAVVADGVDQETAPDGRGRVIGTEPGGIDRGRVETGIGQS